MGLPAMQGVSQQPRASYVPITVVQGASPPPAWLLFARFSGPNEGLVVVKMSQSLSPFQVRCGTVAQER